MRFDKFFVDTSGWADFFIRTQSSHFEAQRLIVEAQSKGMGIFTTNYVITELVALMHARFRVSPQVQINWIDTLRHTDWVQIIHIDRTTDEAAWELCKSRPDKRWSLVDCASFVVMREKHILLALTEDHHFEQAGFVALLKSP
jgi:predicted nucleic acid-binding protein